MNRLISSYIPFVILALTLLLLGCGGGVKHDCQQEGHEWVTGRSGEIRCKYCGVYQQTTTKSQKESKE